MGNIALIGSYALSEHTDVSLPNTTYKDIDIIGTLDDVTSFIKSLDYITHFYPLSSSKYLAIQNNPNLLSGDRVFIECNIAYRDNSNGMILSFIQNDIVTRKTKSLGFIGCNTEVLIPSVDVLYTLKMSHRFLKNSPFFSKTHDHIMFMRSLGASVPHELHDVLALREKETYTYKHPKLNVSKKEFFSDDNIDYVYDHDMIHEIMKHMDKPAYKYFKPENKEVWCDKDMFFSLPEKVRLYAVLEETQVLAIERSQVPFKGVSNITPEYSFNVSLKKVCTSITSGWFRDFAWENYRTVLNMYEPDYVDKFWDNINV